MKTSNTNRKQIKIYDLDSIYTQYMLTMDLKHLKKLYKKKYCEKLISITSDSLLKHFTDGDIENLHNRIEKNEIGLKPHEKEDNKSKSIVCLKISKFYVKIAHLFSAIMLTLNPQLEGAGVKKIKSNLCDSRIHFLSSSFNFINGNINGNKNDNPDNTCPLQLVAYDINTTGKKDVTDEPGVPELIELYYDTDYDLESGEFLGMSSSSNRKFNDDLREFYKTFTQSKKVPPHIKKFSDIKLKYYGKNRSDNDKTKDSNKNTGKKLIEEYALNLREMILFVNEKQEELLTILNKLFIYKSSNGEEIFKINPDITENILQKLIEEARTIIVELYVKCEEDYIKGLKIYEAIVESCILETTQTQLITLEKEMERLYTL